MLKISYHGWKLEVEENQATAADANGEQLEIRKTGSLERSAKLIKAAVDRRTKGGDKVGKW